ncbi:MAG: aminotransferase class III-fold pyridoxal phosphate-dependent enzyme [Dehalococcoidia bacterium]|nr:aminotransferase class III-fold pyridoxal phosphate-dependent enzyme [Dehalococcoidia bacterium]
METIDIFDKLESEVRGYVRGWPTVFEKATGSHMIDENGTKYIDFFAGAGVLNYGHNNPEIKKALLDYLAEDNVVHGLDMATAGQG